MFFQKHQRMEGACCSGSVRYSSRIASPAQDEASVKLLPKCWMCVQVGHLRTYCHQKSDLPGNGRYPRGGQASRSVVLSGLHILTTATSNVPLWVMLDFKTGKVPAMVDTRAQFSCV